MSKYDTFWPRFWAGTVDSLLFIPITWLLDQAWPGEQSGFLTALWLVISYFVFSVYLIVMHSMYGQTLGKIIAGVTVLSEEDEGPITVRQSILRESPYLVLLWLGWVAAVVFLVAKNDSAQFHGIDGVIQNATMVWVILELITMLFSEKRRALHDYIAGTVVVKGR